MDVSNIAGYDRGVWHCYFVTRSVGVGAMAFVVVELAVNSRPSLVGRVSWPFCPRSVARAIVSPISEGSCERPKRT